MLYARINKSTNQMVDSPVELPAILSVGNGVVINGFNCLSDDQLYGFGWVPVNVPENPDPLAFYVCQVPRYDEDSRSFTLPLLPRDLAPLIEDAKRQIDDAASAACLRYLSTGVGQEMRYLMKGSQADDVAKLLSNGEMPDPDKFPMLKLEAEACGVTFYDKVNEVMTTRDAWLQLAAKIEAIRIGSKKDCSAVQSAAELFAIKNNALTDLGAL